MKHQKIKELLGEEIPVVPCYKGTKIPRINNWHNTYQKLKDINSDDNLALILGERSNYVDIDVDDKSFLLFAGHFLPITFSYGRLSNSLPAHFLYNSNNIVEVIKRYKTEQNKLIVELRAKELSVLPGSIYVEENNQDNIIIYNEQQPSTINFDQLISIVKSAFISYIICKNWPAKGFRQDAALAFSAVLFKEGFEYDDVMRILDFAIQESGDEEYKSRISAIDSTYKKFKAGNKSSISGILTLKSIYKEDFVNYFKGLLSDNENKDLIETFNQRYSWIEELAGIWDFNYNKIVRIEALRIKYGHLNCFIKDSKGKVKKINVTELWKESDNKAMYSKVVYEPGKEQIIDNTINIWSGWGCEPKKGDCSIVLDLIEYLIPDKIYKDWFLSWLSYPLQNPGEKNNTAIMLYSRCEGVGKNMLGYFIQKIYGDNCSVVTEDIFTSKFMDIFFAKQFIIGNEITGSDRFKGLDRLKNFITEPYITVDRKFQTPITIKNCINMMLCTNNIDALWLGPKDRRFFCWEIEDDPKPQKFYDDCGEFLNADGANIFFDYLLKYDLKHFNPKAHALITPFKQDIFNLTTSNVEVDIKKLYDMKRLPNGKSNVVTPNYVLDKLGEYFGFSGISMIKVGKVLQKLCKAKRRINYKGRLITLYSLDHGMRNKDNDFWMKTAEELNVIEDKK